MTALRKFGLLFLTVGLLGVVTAAGGQTPVPAAPQLGAKGYILLDHYSGQLLAAKNEHEHLEPASITKLMTAYAVFRALRERQITLEDKVLISEKAWRTPGSRMFIEVNTRVSVDDLIQGMIVQSGNDASVALAEYIAGTEEIFAQLMNQYARELGMLNTNYRNSTGLPNDDHYTTAADIARLAQAIIEQYPEYYRWYSQREFSYNGITQKNRNALLWRDPSVDGMKTGMTDAAGYCLVSSARRDDMRLIAVILGTKSSTARANDSQALLNYGFRFYETRLLYPAGKPLDDARVRVWKGSADSTDLAVRKDLYITIPRGTYDQVQAQVELPTHVVAPVDAEAQLGTLRINLADQTLAEANLFAMNEVAVGSLWRQARDSVLLWFE
ncbi:MAG: D-alanyl-D-alanine carboxypeptidase family protein [Gammaproteobacteria bacterium]|nr:D-alanyl-D-alanine carboxypeptidase family protein [Gammaproteobacteria bacterium]